MNARQILAYRTKNRPNSTEMAPRVLGLTHRQISATLPSDTTLMAPRVCSQTKTKSPKAQGASRTALPLLVTSQDTSTLQSRTPRGQLTLPNTIGHEHTGPSSPVAWPRGRVDLRGEPGVGGRLKRRGQQSRIRELAHTGAVQQHSV